MLAQEKGLNTYTKVDDSKCSAAKDWWNENKEDWKIVRTKWDEVFNKKQNLLLKNEVEDKHLYSYLFSEEFNIDEKSVDQLIDSFIK